MASRHVTWFARYVRSSIGAKQVMAVTGLAMLAFTVVHMVGHLQMFGGPDMYNAYAHTLQNLWEVKWPIRIGLVTVLVIHVATAIRLAAANRAARPVGYAVYRPVVSSLADRTMVLSGLVILAFIIFHLLHFTLGQVQPEFFHRPDAKDRWDAYSMFVHGFQRPSIYVAYLIGIAMLSSHLGHGAASWLQSLGLRHPKYRTDNVGWGISAALFLGFMIPPTAVLVGLISL